MKNQLRKRISLSIRETIDPPVAGEEAAPETEEAAPADDVADAAEAAPAETAEVTDSAADEAEGEKTEA